MNHRILQGIVCIGLLAAVGCAPQVTPTVAVAPTLAPPAASTPVPLATPTGAPGATAPPPPLVPDFKHIVIIVFENKEFGTVIANPDMPYFNELAKSYALLTQFYAVTHPSLPNYLAMIAGDTFGLTFNCVDCLFDATTLPDLIERSGRTWKAYQEDMPSPCFQGIEHKQYAMKHNPFMYFKSIRLDEARCARTVVPFTELALDAASGSLPNYIFITPNECNDAHDCDLEVADAWLSAELPPLQSTLDATGAPYLIVLTWDEGQGNHSCCGLPDEAGGRIATVLISPEVKSGFKDPTQYTGYSLLKTIAESWRLPYLGHAADETSVLILEPWK